MPSEEFRNVLSLIEQMRPQTSPTLDEQRQGLEQAGAMIPAPDDVAYEPVDVGGVPAEWSTPPGDTAGRTVLYLHGGGYSIGSIASHRRLVAHIAQAATARTLSVDYRLGPEHPHPAALEDALTAYRWLIEHGVDASKLAICGDSAGGGLTVATLVALRDAGVPLPAAAVTMSPWVDLTMSGASHETYRDRDPIIVPGRLKTYADWYLCGQDAEQPTASPIRSDLSGLPPMLVQVGQVEALLDDARMLADKAKAAGVDVALDVWEDMVHLWQFFVPAVPEASVAVERIGAFLRERLG